MKIFRLLTLVMVMQCSVTAYAQRTNNCGFVIPPQSLLRTKFQSVYEAAGIVKSMLDSIKWKENFNLQEQNGINNAYATIIRNKRWIIYDNNFLENLDGYAATKWASISVMAHEMGHHFHNHVVSGRGSTIPTEIEADAFSGYVMNKMGATLAQSVAAMQTIASDRASATHPAKKDRVASITNGWNRANSERGNTGGTNTNTGNTGNNNGNTGGNPGGNTGNNTNTDPSTDPSWIALTMNSRKNETVYLSDDGKNYSPAEIKAGESFVFKFEIYSYGWLRLPYYNGFRVFKLLHGKDYTIIWNRRNKNWTVVEVPE
jgi:Peptidase family M48